MNLKETFRYQTFLENLMRNATMSIQSQSHCYTVTKHHYKSKTNPEAVDVDETVVTEDFYPTDKVIAFAQWLIAEREKLSQAITKAKASLDFDVDAAIETNKFRQQLSGSIQNITRCKPIKKSERGMDYKFNVNGDQVSYYYDVDVEYKDAFDRDGAKAIMRSVIKDSDKVSADIDAAMINTKVDYAPRFDVNESFDDVMAEFITDMEDALQEA